MTPARALLIEQALRAAGVNDSGGELILEVTRDHFGEALFAFAQALTRIVEVAKWTKEHVRSTFIDDFRDLLSSVIPADRIQFDYSDPVHDPDGKYAVDCKVNGMPRPLYVFAVNGDLKCKDATIAIHQLRDWNDNFESMAIFENQSQIARNTLARFSDVVGKQFSSVSVKPEIVDYLTHHVAGLRPRVPVSVTH
jgi:hypothetical protein